MKRLPVIFDNFSYYNMLLVFPALVRCDIITDMAVTLAQFRTALGSKAAGVSDAELQKRLDYMYRFADSFYDWWHERKGEEFVTFAGGGGNKYLRDHYDDIDRSVEKIKATEPNTYLLGTWDREKAEEMRQMQKEQYEKRGDQN